MADESQDWKEFANRMEKLVETFYILDREHQVVEARSYLHWGVWFQNIDRRRVGQDIFGKYRVSTVFLGLDHNMDPDGSPQLFETMVFNEEDKDEKGRPTGRDLDTARYGTWEEAEMGHQDMIAKWKAKS